ncbi:MAG: hypothetical protein HOC71_06115 [Candidatus Latescibacteria bacterium]|nr:hypothetical protein [Candidatus Latescibacterota bacterium]
MKRRSFLETGLGTTALAAGMTGCTEKEQQITPGVDSGDISVIGVKTLEELRDLYRYDIFDDFVVFFDRYIVDQKYGGFLCTTDHDGTNISTNKSATTLGRGIWCYSFLYNNLAKEDRFLDIASKAVEFTMKHHPSGDNFWPGNYSQEGQTDKSGRGGLAGDCYIAEGLAEYGKATGERKYIDIGKETMTKCMKIYDRPDFQDGASPYPGARNLWYWMLFMWFGTNTLKYESDPELEKRTARCVSAIMDHHQHPKFDLMNNVINHDLSRSDDPKYSECAGCGHATEATWMILYEAVRKKDRALFDLTAERFSRHAVVSKDDVYGGYFNDCINVDENRWQLSKITWANTFILINSLYIIEHTGAQWAKDIFSDQFDYVRENYPLKKYGYHMWEGNTDRKFTHVPHVRRKGIYHHQRHLMLNLLSLERMIAQGGKISGMFA